VNEDQNKYRYKTTRDDNRNDYRYKVKKNEEDPINEEDKKKVEMVAQAIMRFTEEKKKEEEKEKKEEGNRYDGKSQRYNYYDKDNTGSSYSPQSRRRRIEKRNVDN
jgi:hypothetical protein